MSRQVKFGRGWTRILRKTPWSHGHLVHVRSRAPGWMEMTGNDEEELLNRFPSYRGTKP